MPTGKRRRLGNTGMKGKGGGMVVRLESWIGPAHAVSREMLSGMEPTLELDTPGI